jgi:polyhydroxybutyrate depolymerase
MLQDLYLGMTRHARSDGFYLVLPDGTLDDAGEEHWDVLGLEVDDHAYLRGLIEEAMSLVPVSRVFLVGHSNGAFMAFRLACDSADLVDAVASFAGSDVSMPCTSDVAVLQIHGTADDTILYEGGTIRGLPYPGAEAIVTAWAGELGCTGSHPGETFDFVTTVEGPETTTLEYDGCRGAALWTIEGGGHIPMITGDFTPAIIAWLRATN